MSILDEFSARRAQKAKEVADDLRQSAEEQASYRRAVRQRNLKRLSDSVNANVRYFFGLVTALVCGWSLYSLGKAVGMPGWVGVLAAVTIDGAWLYCLLQTHLNRETPYRALGAYTTSQLLLVVSVALNLVHGLVAFGFTTFGVAAGLLFAFFPVILKVIVSQSTQNPIAHLLKVPGGRSALKQMGLDRASQALRALKEREQVEQYRLSQTSQVELARIDLAAEHEVRGLQAALEASVRQLSGLSAGQPDKTDKTDGVRTLSPDNDGHRPDASGPSGHQPSATAPTGPDTVRTEQSVLPDTRPQIKIIRELLDQGTDHERIIDHVLKVKPDAKEDSVRRAIRREVGNIV